MPLHAFIDFLSWSPGAHRSAGCGLRGGPRRRQGSRPGHYTLPQCPDGGYQPAAAGRPAQAHLWWSEAQSKHGNLLNGPQDEAAAHMAASLRPTGSHPIRVAAWHLELLSGGQGRDEDLTASG